jgi:hypothetical protein
VAEHEQAEEATAQALGSLPPGAWAVIHDHAVVGPQGVFVITSLELAGRVTVEGGMLRQDGNALSSTVLGATTAAAVVAGLVPEHRDHVRAVICVGGSEGPIALLGDVLVCSSNTLVTMLTTRPAVLSDKEVHGIVRLLRSGLGAPKQPGAGTGFVGKAFGVVRRRKRG